MAFEQNENDSFLKDLESCRNFQGEVKEFWQKFSQTLGDYPQITAVRILTQVESAWKVITSSSGNANQGTQLTKEQWESLAEEAENQGIGTYKNGGLNLSLVKLRLQEEEAKIYAELTLKDGADVLLSGAILSLISEVPLLYQESLNKRRLEKQLKDFSCALEVLSAVNEPRHFSPASMALVNEIANRFNATRVFLGWVEGHYIKTCAMNGTERFERKVEIIQRLEAAMEECRDQEEEILFPQTEGTDSITRCHEAYTQDAHVKTVLSIPLRVGDKVCAVLTLEKEKGSFSAQELITLRIIADQVAPVLLDLKKAARWFGRRWADSGKECFSKILGPHHTWMKVGAISLTLFLAFALFFPYTYRVKANFIVVPDSQVLIPAPFQGYISAVNYRPGDLVPLNGILLSMDQGELKVQEASALADLKRYSAESEQAEAQGDLGAFRVATELAGQAEARLKLVRYRLNRAEIMAPFEGILVEGDLRDRLGSPVEQGEILMRFSRLDGLFLEIELPERDIDLLDGSGLGQIAFASRPDLKIPMEILKIEPSAVAGEADNFFVIRAEMVEEKSDWLRPGMTGVAKLDAGKRTLAWRATHRLIDFIRMFFWV